MDLEELVQEALRATAGELVELAHRVRELLARERGRVGDMEVLGHLVKLPSSGRAIVVGDIHGDLESLYHILRETDFLTRAGEGEPVYLVMLGDYGDRGARSPEVYYVILELKSSLPENVVLLRGNHEGPPDLLAIPHDLPYHMAQKFGPEGREAYRAVVELWDALHVAAVVEGSLVMLHGGHVDV